MYLLKFTTLCFKPCDNIFQAFQNTSGIMKLTLHTITLSSLRYPSQITRYSSHRSTALLIGLQCSSGKTRANTILSVARITFFRWYDGVRLFYLKEAALLITLVLETIHYITLRSMNEDLNHFYKNRILLEFLL